MEKVDDPNPGATGQRGGAHLTGNFWSGHDKAELWKWAAWSGSAPALRCC
jgi:hypothetical protein